MSPSKNGKEQTTQLVTEIHSVISWRRKLALIKIIGQLKNPHEVAQNMHNGSLDQGLLICLGYAYFFSIPEPE